MEISKYVIQVVSKVVTQVWWSIRICEMSKEKSSHIVCIQSPINQLCVTMLWHDAIFYARDNNFEIISKYI